VHGGSRNTEGELLLKFGLGNRKHLVQQGRSKEDNVSCKMFNCIIQSVFHSESNYEIKPTCLGLKAKQIYESSF
jgi:hypothetical protein